MKLSVSKYQGVSSRIGKTLSTSVRDRMLIGDHQVARGDFRVPGSESNQFVLELKQSLFIKRDRPTLTGTDSLGNCYYTCHFE